MYPDTEKGGDIREAYKVALELEQVQDRPVRDVMTSNPIYVYESDSPAAALAVMAVSGYRHVPILDLDDNLIGIGSGGNYALAAARALIDRDDLDAEAIARKAMDIAAGICVYTNDNVILESLSAS